MNKNQFLIEEESILFDKIQDLYKAAAKELFHDVKHSYDPSEMLRGINYLLDVARSEFKGITKECDAAERQMEIALLRTKRTCGKDPNEFEPITYARYSLDQIDMYAEGFFWDADDIASDKRLDREDEEALANWIRKTGRAAEYADAAHRLHESISVLRSILNDVETVSGKRK